MPGCGREELRMSGCVAWEGEQGEGMGGWMCWGEGEGMGVRVCWGGEVNVLSVCVAERGGCRCHCVLREGGEGEMLGCVGEGKVC